MRTLIPAAARSSLLVSIVFFALIAALLVLPDASANDTRDRTAVELAGFDLAPGVGAVEAPPSETELRARALGALFEDAVIEWSPVKIHVFWGEPEEHYRARASDFVRSVLAIALEPKEAPLARYAKLEHPRSRTALFMIAQASIESDFADYVDDGRCNDASWRASAAAIGVMHGDCDYSITPTGAWTPWQIHVDEQGGVFLTDDGWLSPAMAGRTRARGVLVHGPDVVASGPDVASRRLLAARVALHWMRATPTAWGSAWGAHERATAWIAKHPLPSDAP